ncbi:unnamed protein product [Rangifer tarandus platyrhynchus]|uniref:Uncharacterized protein n=1 Tax=Rangifer tarandus platyrhynchus TaxID=3082113 RepID=A0AC59Z2T2_RANTA
MVVRAQILADHVPGGKCAQGEDSQSGAGLPGACLAGDLGRRSCSHLTAEPGFQRCPSREPGQMRWAATEHTPQPPGQVLWPLQGNMGSEPWASDADCPICTGTTCQQRLDPSVGIKKSPRCRDKGRDALTISRRSLSAGSDNVLCPPWHPGHRSSIKM